MTEICNAITARLDDPAMDNEGIMKYVPGPDFPTGGIIYGRAGIKDAYRTGRGRLVVRAVAEIETDAKTERDRIVVTEIPYQVNKASMIERIADLVKEGHLEGISDLRDESDRRGMRVVIELKRDANSRVVLNKLFHHTQMQQTFGVNMLALVNNRPKTVKLLELVDAYVEHRKEVVVRRTRFDLDKAEKRAHILEGYRIALDNIDELVKLIRSAADPADASQKMQARFGLSELQAEAILEMRLQRLTGLERDKVEAEYRETIQLIERLKAILASPQMVLDIIKAEVVALRDRYGDPRRTQIVDATGEFEVEDLIANEPMVITVSHNGYIKRLPTATYRRQHRGGRGVSGFGGQEDDFVEQIFIASTHSYLLFFSNRGRCYWVKVHELPQAGRTARGKAIVNLLQLSPQERITSTVPVKDFKEPGCYLVMATRKGTIKRCDLIDFSNPRKGGIIAIGLHEGDGLVGVALTRGQAEIVLAKRAGKAVRFKETDVRSMGRAAAGVRGAELEGDDDEVIGMVAVTRPDAEILVVTENGFGKRTPIDDYRLTARGTKGVLTLKTTDKNGPLVAVKEVVQDDELMIITKKGVLIRVPVSGVSELGRATQGVRLIRVEDGDEVAAVAHVARDAELAAAEGDVVDAADADTGDEGDDVSTENGESAGDSAE
jgi:DNA gyrase subunit A